MTDANDRALKEYWQARTENLKEQVSIFDVLDLYNINYRYKDVEVQFPCPLHGDGTDKANSARVYQKTDTTYCWACKKARDQIQWVRDYEGLSFSETVKVLENKFNITGVPSIYEYVDSSFDKDELGKTEFEKEIESILDEVKVPTDKEEFSFEAFEKKIDRFVSAFQNELSLKGVLKMYHTFDSVKWDYENGNLNSNKTKRILSQIAEQIQKYRKKHE